MKNLKKIAPFIILMILFNCRVSSKLDVIFQHENKNPCETDKIFKSIDCIDWMKNNPKEYRMYMKKIKREGFVQ